MRVLRIRKADFLSVWSMKCMVFLSSQLSESGDDFGAGVDVGGERLI